MSITEDVRAQLRARKTAPATPAWRPPGISDFLPDVQMLAFDASLANVGWVLMLVRGDRVLIMAHGTIHPQQTDDGYMGTWQRARDLRRGLREAGIDGYMRYPGVLKAVEAPVVGAGHRKESSLIAGMTVWAECDECAVISATHVSAVLLGDPKIKSDVRKPAIKAAVLRYVPEAQGRGWDEHQRDALSVGFTRLFDMRQEAA